MHCDTGKYSISYVFLFRFFFLFLKFYYKLSTKYLEVYERNFTSKIFEIYLFPKIDFLIINEIKELIPPRAKRI